MEKLLTFLNNNIDKVTHFLSGYMLSTFFHLPIQGFYAVITVGIAKEIYDYFHPNHTCDIWDAIATISGATLAFLIMTGR